MKALLLSLMAVATLLLASNFVNAQDETPPTPVEKAQSTADDGLKKGDTAWMLVASAFVMFMLPGLALFYGGLVRRKNVLATMMHSMAALAVVGVYWIAVGYAFAFGPSIGGVIGWDPKLVFLNGYGPGDYLPNTNIPIYLHVMYQGMFAIITPALISGAIAERIRFIPYCIFLILWVTFVYCPLAHCVWAMNWWGPITVDGVVKDPGTAMVGLLGAMGALDFAGGTVVHISAGLAGLAAIMVLKKRAGYPEHAMHPNSVVLTLLGAGFLWFGWFGFNGGSYLGTTKEAVAAFSATQAAAAAAGLTWMIAEWLHKQKPTAVGLATGIVAGLVAVTPASGYVTIWAGLIIGVAAAVVCYTMVALKPVLKYDDSLDAFGVHGVGGFVGAILTGVFCTSAVNAAVTTEGLAMGGGLGQLWTQFVAAAGSVVFALVVSLVLVKVVDLVLGFSANDEEETLGLDRTQHGEVGFDYGMIQEVSEAVYKEPRPAAVPPNGDKRFTVVIDGPSPELLTKAWSELCQVGPTPPSADFKAIYPYLTTVQGNRFRFRGGNPETMRSNLISLFKGKVPGTVRVRVET